MQRCPHGPISRFLLTVLFACAFVAASGQDYPGDRRVTIKGRNIRVHDLFYRIWEQTDMQAFYNDEQLSRNLRITVNFKNEPLDNVLDWLTRGRKISWCYRDDNFIITPVYEFEEPVEAPPEPIKKEPLKIRGTVRSIDGAPLPGRTAALPSAACRLRAAPAPNCW